MSESSRRVTLGSVVLALGLVAPGAAAAPLPDEGAWYAEAHMLRAELHAFLGRWREEQVRLAGAGRLRVEWEVERAALRRAEERSAEERALWERELVAAEEAVSRARAAADLRLGASAEHRSTCEALDAEAYEAHLGWYEAWREVASSYVSPGGGDPTDPRRAELYTMIRAWETARAASPCALPGFRGCRVDSEQAFAPVTVEQIWRSADAARDSVASARARVGSLLPEPVASGVDTLLARYEAARGTCGAYLGAVEALHADTAAFVTPVACETGAAPVPECQALHAALQEREAARHGLTSVELDLERVRAERTHLDARISGLPEANPALADAAGQLLRRYDALLRQMESLAGPVSQEAWCGALVGAGLARHVAWGGEPGDALVSAASTWPEGCHGAIRGYLDIPGVEGIWAEAVSRATAAPLVELRLAAGSDWFLDGTPISTVFDGSVWIRPGTHRLEAHAWVDENFVLDASGYGVPSGDVRPERLVRARVERLDGSSAWSARPSPSDVAIERFPPVEVVSIRGAGQEGAVSLEGRGSPAPFLRPPPVPIRRPLPPWACWMAGGAGLALGAGGAWAFGASADARALARSTSNDALAGAYLTESRWTMALGLAGGGLGAGLIAVPVGCAVGARG